MPKSVNKAILIGNVGKDPEVKYTASGIALQSSAWQPTKVSKTRAANGKTAPNGTTLSPGSIWPKLSGNMCIRSQSFTSKANFKL